MIKGLHLGSAGRSCVAVAGVVAVASCEVGDDSVEDLGRAALPLEVAAAADTYVVSGTPNRNHGGLSTLKLQSLTRNRALVRFDDAELVTAAAGGSLVAAHLALAVTESPRYWGTGRPIDLHRLTIPWTEFGATWNCAVDPDPGDFWPACPGTAWSMDGLLPRPWVASPSDAFMMNDDVVGDVKFDVTTDVAAFLAGTAENHGWIVKKRDELAAGRVELGARESGSGPRLLLTFNPSGSGGGSGGHGGDGTATSTVGAGGSETSPASSTTTTGTAPGTGGSSPTSTDAGGSPSAATTTGAGGTTSSAECDPGDLDDGNPCTIDSCDAALGVRAPSG